jgi:hypothetical protein
MMTSVPGRRPERSNFCPEGTLKDLMLIVVHFLALRTYGKGVWVSWGQRKIGERDRRRDVRGNVPEGGNRSRASPRKGVGENERGRSEEEEGGKGKHG